MTYEDVRKRAQSGDLVLLEGNGFVSKAIRVLTGQSISHVAMLVWLHDGLFIAEMTEGNGYQLTPASQRVGSMAGIIYYGEAPKVVQAKPGCIVEQVSLYRADKKRQRYGYLSLVKIWWAQLWHKSYTPARKVCSTFVQETWEKCGYHFAQTADPGDFVGICQYVARIEG